MPVHYVEQLLVPRLLPVLIEQSIQAGLSESDKEGLKTVSYLVYYR